MLLKGLLFIYETHQQQMLLIKLHQTFDIVLVVGGWGGFAFVFL
jgi:hypothetical protein